MTNAHTALVRAIQGELGALPGVLVLANNQGTARFMNPRTEREYTVRLGLGPGTPDLLLILAPYGRLLGLECKTGTGRPTPEQKQCHSVWASFGAHVVVVHTVAEAREALRCAQARGAS